MKRFFLVLILALTVACAGHLPPNATPQMKVAAYGGDVVATVNLIAQTTAGLPMADSAKAPIMIVANRIQRLGPKLADALDAYDLASATDKQAKADAITAITDEITSVVSSLKLPADTTVGKVANLILQLGSSLTQIRSALMANGNLHPVVT